MCIRDSWCDGQDDCFDGSDEQSCKLRQRFLRELSKLNTLLWRGGVLFRAWNLIKRSLRSPGRSTYIATVGKLFIQAGLKFRSVQ